MDGTEPAAHSPIPTRLLDAGDPAFVAALRAVADPAALAHFAADWYADPRPLARAFLLHYLDQPPNAPGHEGLAKRLFKLAEAAGDDAAMARFLVLCDRLIVGSPWIARRNRRRRFATAEEAQAHADRWMAHGWGRVHQNGTLARLFGEKRFAVWGRHPRTFNLTRGTTLPRADRRHAAAPAALPDAERAGRRWFAVATRRHLRRRAWRYFRDLGRTDPARYLDAATAALTLYRDAELATGARLLDHFGLVHILFGQSRVLRRDPSGWGMTPGRSPAELAPSPAFESAWRDHPAAVLRVLVGSQAAVVARWALRLVEADPERFFAMGTAEDWVALLDRADPEVVALALAMLDRLGPDRICTEIPAGAWPAVAEAASPASRSAVAGFVARMVRPDEVGRLDAVRLATSNDESLARLGWSWVEAQGLAADRGEDDASAVLGLLDARCPALRPAILRAVRVGLAARPGPRAEWAWAFLDHATADARAAGWVWLRADDALRGDPDLWAKLAASPYPDVRAAIATTRGPIPVEAEQLEPAWAAVLLDPVGSARAKPGAIRRVVARLSQIPPDAEAEAGRLIALLGDVARSPRAPERRAALAALVGLAERRPEWAGLVAGAVPALQWAPGPAIVPGSD